MITSAKPAPSLPGSQAATNASDALISGFTQSGRPERNTETVGTPAAFSFLSKASACLSPGWNSSVGMSPRISA